MRRSGPWCCASAHMQAPWGRATTGTCPGPSSARSSSTCPSTTASRTMRSMLTADTNLVEVRSAVQYTQPDPRKYLFKVKDVEDTLRQVSESALREAVGQASLDKALAFDPAHHRSRAGDPAAHARQLRHGIAHHQRDAAGGRGARGRAGRAARCDQSGQGPPALSAGRGELQQRCRAARARRGLRSSCSMRRPTGSRCSRSPRARLRGSIKCSSNTSTRRR